MCIAVARGRHCTAVSGLCLAVERTGCVRACARVHSGGGSLAAVVCQQKDYELAVAGKDVAQAVRTHPTYSRTTLSTPKAAMPRPGSQDNNPARQTGKQVLADSALSAFWLQDDGGGTLLPRKARLLLIRARWKGNTAARPTSGSRCRQACRAVRLFCLKRHGCCLLYTTRPSCLPF